MSSADHLLVGLTGSIGAGKSTVATAFSEAGIPVLAADEIARELMQTDLSVKSAISELLGPEVYSGNGQLDRRAIAALVFDNESLLAELNDIVHPPTIAEQGRRAAALFAEGRRVVACEAALIFETEGEGRFDYIVVVDADRETRLQRAADRSGSSIDDVRTRDERQMRAETKVERADFVLRNDGTLDEIANRARFLAALLLSLPPRSGLDIDDDSAEEDFGDTETVH